MKKTSLSNQEKRSNETNEVDPKTDFVDLIIEMKKKQRRKSKWQHSNLINVDTITPVVNVGVVNTSRSSDIVDVTAEYCAKINSLIIANIDGTNAADITVEVSTDNVPLCKNCEYDFCTASLFFISYW